MKATLISVLILLCAGVAALYFGQRKLIFPAPKEVLPAELPVDVELVNLQIGHALLLMPENAEAPVPLLVYAHGNAEVAHWSLDSFAYFSDRGIAVLLLEYPGYGGAPGSPSADSTIRSGLMAIDAVLNRPDIDSEKLIMHGRSIGSGVASQLALQRNGNALILEAPFSSLKTLVAEIGYPAFLLRERFDNAAAISVLDIPVLLYHGTEDSLIPLHHSEQLAALNKRVTLLKASCGHNDCPRPWEQIMRFLQAEKVL